MLAKLRHVVRSRTDTRTPSFVDDDGLKKTHHAHLEYRKGRAPRGDSLLQLKQIAQDWIDANGAAHGITQEMEVIRVLREHGHQLLFTPPYMPELQPIEKLWRSVKQHVARHYAGGRTMKDLQWQLLEGFEKYGNAAHCARIVALARDWEKRYCTEEVYGIAPPPVIDLANDESDDDADVDDAHGCGMAEVEDAFEWDTDDDDC